MRRTNQRTQVDDSYKLHLSFYITTAILYYFPKVITDLVKPPTALDSACYTSHFEGALQPNVRVRTIHPHREGAEGSSRDIELIIP